MESKMMSLICFLVGSVVVLQLASGLAASEISVPNSLVYKGTRLTQNETLHKNEYIGTIGGYTLVMQGDCNLVLYDANQVASSATGTERTGVTNCYATLQGDGNFVLYEAFEKPIWGSATWSLLPNYKGYFVEIVEVDLERHSKLVITNIDHIPLWVGENVQWPGESVNEVCPTDQPVMDCIKAQPFCQAVGTCESGW